MGFQTLTDIQHSWRVKQEPARSKAVLRVWTTCPLWWSTQTDKHSQPPTRQPPKRIPCGGWFMMFLYFIQQAVSMEQLWRTHGKVLSYSLFQAHNHSPSKVIMKNFQCYYGFYCNFSYTQTHTPKGSLYTLTVPRMSIYFVISNNFKDQNKYS